MQPHPAGPRSPGMLYSLGDLCDRLTILELKMQRIGRERFVGEYEAVHRAVFEASLPTLPTAVAEEVKMLLLELRTINGDIWDLESDIRRGKDNQMSLEEVGRRAIAIRDINEKRVKTKNRINGISDTGFQEFKSTWRV